MAAFEYRQAEEIRDTFARRKVRYLFLGKSAAILLGFPDTTQDADLFGEEIRRGKHFVQLKNGHFDLYLIFAPDGIEVAGFPVCDIDDVIRSPEHRTREMKPLVSHRQQSWIAVT